MTLTSAQYSKTQQRLLTAFGGLGVAALAAGTFVLSYDDLRLLALRGGAARHWAFLYPCMVDGLVVVVILSILTARRSNWFSRTIRWLLLILLIGGAGAAGVQRAVKGYAVLSDTPVNVGVAVAPWAALIIAVWLWVAMIKHLLGTRRPPRPPRSPRREPPGAVEAVPATVVDQSIIPGLGPADTRQLPLASVRELGPVREEGEREPAEPFAAPAPSEPEGNPWDAARIDAPYEPEHAPYEPEREHGRPGEGPEADGTQDPGLPTAEAEEADRAGEVPEAAHAEPSDPVPPSWLAEPELSPADLSAEDDTQPLRTRTAPAKEERRAPSWQDEAATEPDAWESDMREPEPLLPPTRSRLEERADEPHEEAAMTDEPAEDEPAPRWVARPFLPTDVRLVGGPKSLPDTRPDGIRLPDTNPDGIPLVTKARDAAADPGDEEDDGYLDERAEDPDAGDEADAPWEESAATPPSSKFRSGPTPPRG